jgi:hypothetical protein
MASTIWIDDDGFEWNKSCTLCGNYERAGWDARNKKRIGKGTNADVTMQYCSSYQRPLFLDGVDQEPFYSYYNAGKPHDCPHFWCNDDD